MQKQLPQKRKGLGWLDVFTGKRMKKCYLFQPELISLLPNLPVFNCNRENTLGLHYC